MQIILSGIIIVLAAIPTIFLGKQISNRIFNKKLLFLSIIIAYFIISFVAFIIIHVLFFLEPPQQSVNPYFKPPTLLRNELGFAFLALIWPLSLIASNLEFAFASLGLIRGH